MSGSHAFADKNFVDVFLSSHRYFIDSLKLLEKIMERYFTKPANKDDAKAESRHVYTQIRYTRAAHCYVTCIN